MILPGLATGLLFHFFISYLFCKLVLTNKNLFMKTNCLILFTFLFGIISPSYAQQDVGLTGHWKGNAVLGNGKVCVVYSDDPRIEAKTHRKGIQHLYFNDYTADYVSSAYFQLSDHNKKILQGKNSIGLKNFFTTLTTTHFKNDGFSRVTCFVHPNDAVVVSLKIKGFTEDLNQTFHLYLNKDIITDRKIVLTSLTGRKNIATASWSNKKVLLAACLDSQASISYKDSIITFSGKIKQNKSVEILIIPANSKKEAYEKFNSLKKLKSIFASASKYWETWINKGLIPKFPKSFKERNLYTSFFKRTLYSVKSANLNGQIPADITGQFTTNNMPQLYPRDAMMCARVFLLTNHFKEAKQVINFWTKKDIPHKSKGEFFARYDAFAKAVDAGSGARYNEPEWDANGYLIQLLNEYHLKTGKWLADKNFIYSLADFLVSHIDKNGLLYEGGIVEWTGYLPSTNMTCAAALRTASTIAEDFGDSGKAKEYKNAYEKISSSLYKLYDKKINAYTDVRFHGGKAKDNSSISDQTADTLYLLDTSMNFGILWGYPDNIYIENSNKFFLSHNVILNGGLQYFQTEDPGLVSYGSAAFFFTTSASSEYQSMYGSKETAKEQIDWMIKNSNIYGLMPERIYPDGSDCSEASPLSWCNAEFAAAVVAFSK
jgi:GH15 family glucan-1,4-alpha-glucosidase